MSINDWSFARFLECSSPPSLLAQDGSGGLGVGGIRVPLDLGWDVARLSAHSANGMVMPTSAGKAMSRVGMSRPATDVFF